MVQRFNNWLAQCVTSAVATMWCAYLFCALALISLPAAIAGGVATLVAWTAQTFIQLVLLSIIMVGQKVEGAKTEARDAETHDAVMTMLHEAHKLHVRIEAGHNKIHQHLGIEK